MASTKYTALPAHQPDDSIPARDDSQPDEKPIVRAEKSISTTPWIASTALLLVVCVVLSIQLWKISNMFPFGTYETRFSTDMGLSNHAILIRWMELTVSRFA